MAKKIDIGGELHSVATGNIVADAKEIKYRPTGKEEKTQAQVNDEVLAAISEGGSVETQINDKINALNATKSQSAGADGLALSVTEENGKITAISGSIAANTYDAYGAASTVKSEVVGDATSSGNTLKKLEDRVSPLETAVGSGDSIDTRISNAVATETTRAQQAESSLSTGKADKATTLAGYGITDAYTKSEIYTKTQVHDLVDTPHQNYVTVATYSALPPTGSEDTIYRVSNYDGSTSTVTPTMYSEYAYSANDLTTPVFLCVKSQIGEVFDISVYNNSAKYADLAAALNGGANIPESLQKGGMSVKFVQSSDNKYVQYLLTKDEWSASEADWQKMNLEKEVDDLIQNADLDDDFDISDENANVIARFVGGNILTKEFNSSKSPACEDDSTTDYSVQDNNGNIIVGIFDGYPITKNFNGRIINERITALEDKNGELEGWSKMPALGENPLSFVRFDGGMGRIFRTWGFIGDSLDSGEMYGKTTAVLSLAVAYDGYEISSGVLSPQSGSVVTEEYAVSAYQPKLKLVFQSNSGLSGKVLAASVSGGIYSTILTGDTATTYTIALTSGQSIIISYPSSNIPQILFGSTYVSDMYDLSWGQQMVRLLGSSGYNFSVGGEYCKRWCIGTDNNRRWQKAQTELKDVYTIALGVNDRNYWLANNTAVVDYPCVSAYPNQSQYGSLTITKVQVLADINLDNYDNNANSYAGWYAGIIQRLKSVRPDAHIFCITNPGEVGGKEWNQTIRLVVEIMQEKYGNTIWLLDLETYNPNTPEINANCNLNGHWSAFGYLYAAYEISTYIDWLIRKNINAFRGTSLIGTGSSANEWEIV